MSDLNSWSITGRLTRDAEYRMLASGKALLSCGVAVNTGWGEYKKTTFAKINQWGEKGANLCQYLKKGKLVGATGILTVNVWQGKDGKEHAELVLDTSSIQLLGGDSTQEADKPPKKPADAVSERREEELEEVPF